MLLFPVFLLLQVLFITGLTMALSTASAAFRDVKHLVDVGLSIGFWLTPIIYEPTMVPEQFREVALLAPMTSYIRAYQDIFYYGVLAGPGDLDRRHGLRGRRVRVRAERVPGLRVAHAGAGLTWTP